MAGLFVWSFYDEPDANVFLRRAHHYFAGHDDIEAKGTGWFHALKESLSHGGRHVLVLDGLERIQRASTEARGVYGELEDPLLKGLLRRLVAGVGETQVVITSRFPVSDLESWLGKGYTVLDVDQLDQPTALELLRTRGIEATDEELERLIGAFGRHALTLDLLAGYIEQVNGGRVDVSAPETPVDTESSQSERLAHILNLFLAGLPARQVDLLVRMCIFRFGVSEEALSEIFAQATDPKIAGELGGIDPAELRREIAVLESLHLVHAAESNYTVHPAVRDHYYQVFRDPDGLHEAISSHLMTLTGRPGVGLPTENSALDLLEELIYHAMKAGKVDEAVHVYFDRMGGNDHLNVTLGEYARTYRILKAIPDCPDASAMYHCLRSFGRFEEALQWRPQNKYILLLEGDLANLAQDPANRASRIAWFLRGESTAIPDRVPDFPLCVAWLHLCRGNIDDAKRVALEEIAKTLYVDDAMRNRIALSEAELRLDRLESALEHMRIASEWILRSSSHEHLCLMHGVRAKLAAAQRNWAEANAALDEAIHLAAESDFRLLEVDLWATRSSVLRREGKPEAAVEAAKRARNWAESPSMGYVWGAKSARREEGIALIEMGEIEEAEAVLTILAELQKRLEDPELAQTERRIAELRGGRSTSIP